MYNLYDMYLRGNSVGCCPLYVGYYLLYVLTGELNRYRPDRQTDRRTHFKSFHCTSREGLRHVAIMRSDEDGTILAHILHGSDWYIEKGGNAPRAPD